VPQEVRTDTTATTRVHTDKTVAQFYKEGIQTLTTLIEINLTTVRLFSFVVQNNHFISTFTLFVSLPRPIRVNIPSLTHLLVLGKAQRMMQGVTTLLEDTQSNQEHQEIVHHNAEELNESDQPDKEN
jgi:hypothetical protein